ncbi:MAG: ROK family protein [Pseudomonadota bacterium]|nr:ROK family protein [Pseudomonadota bacterium]
MITLHDRLAELALHPRAAPWTIRLHSGYSSAAMARDYVLFAPPNAEAARYILARLHNAVLLSNPAAAQLEAPVTPDKLEPVLGALRRIHHVGIFLDGEDIRPTRPDFDLPSVDVPPAFVPAEGLAAGLDIGGTGMKACVLRDGQLLRVSSAPTWPDGEQGIDSLISRARALIEEVGQGERMGSLGIGFASPMGVGGRVTELSTVMREKVGDVHAFDGFAGRVAEGLIQGPVAIFNDLANLGRHLSAQGARRLVRLQIGTSFGGCWIDANGTVYATEMGRLVVDAGPDAVPHPYLPIAGAARAYLSNRGLAEDLGRRMERTLDPRTAGHRLREGLVAGDARALAALDRMADTMRGVIAELHAVLPGVTAVECGGSMLQGVAGKALASRLEDGLPVEFHIAAHPGHDGAVAAAMAPRVDARLKGLKRVG